MKRSFFILLAVFLFLLMYGFTESSFFTGQNTSRLIQVAVGVSNERAELVNLIIRKFTHFCLFGSFAVILYAALCRWKRVKKPVLTAWAFAALAGAFDEMHQFFQQGRTASFIDVCIDAFGAAFFLGTVLFMEWCTEEAVKTSLLGNGEDNQQMK